MPQKDPLKHPQQPAHGEIWVLTADAGRVRIFSAKQFNGELIEKDDLVNPEIRLRESESTSTPKGRTTRGSSRVGQTFEPRHTQSEHSAELFAKNICEWMESARRNGKVSRIYLISEPSFLGLIRKNLNPATKPLIIQELPRDMSRQSAADVRAALPRRL